MAAPTTSATSAKSRRFIGSHRLEHQPRIRDHPAAPAALDRGRRARRSRDLRRHRPHPDPGARRRDEPPLARRRLLAPVLDLRRARSHSPGKTGRRAPPTVSLRSPSPRPWPTSPSSHLRGGDAPTAWRATSRSRATRGCRSRARSRPGTPPPRSRSRPASATCRRRPPSRCARSPRCRLLARPHRRALSRRRARRRPDRHRTGAAHDTRSPAAGPVGWPASGAGCRASRSRPAPSTDWSMELSFPAAGPCPRPIQPTLTVHFCRRQKHLATILQPPRPGGHRPVGMKSRQFQRAGVTGWALLSRRGPAGIMRCSTKCRGRDFIPSGRCRGGSGAVP